MVANLTRRTPSRRAFKQEFTLQTQSVGSYVDGIYVAGASTDIALNGSVQPADGDTVQQLEEAERQSDALSIWTNAIDDTGAVVKIKPVRFGDQQTQGDKIVYDGFTYNVRRVWDYNAHGHQEILAVKVEGQNG